MIRISFTAAFLRELKSLESKDRALYEESIEKINEFGNKNSHTKLKVHKLHGKLHGYWSFSVNYKFRILFRMVSRDHFVFHDIGDHDIYK
jgi:addiction module RelE/StbE family toxin